jgi:hypothetical protein
MTSNNNTLKAQLRDGRAALNCWGSEVMCSEGSYIYATFDDQMLFLIKKGKMAAVRNFYSLSF